MVKVAKSIDKDNDFLSKLRTLEAHILINKSLPTHSDDKKLYNFIIKLRQKYRQNPTLAFWEWRVPMLMKLGVNITAAATIESTPSPSNTEPNWREALNQVRRILSHDQLKSDLAWFDAIIDLFSNKDGFLKQKRYKTFQELIVKWLKVGDIKAFECKRNQPSYDIRHTLSYIRSPLGFLETSAPLVPKWRLPDHQGDIAKIPTYTVPLQYGNTVYFSPSSFDPNMFVNALRELPEWMTKFHKQEIYPKGYDLVRLVSSCKFFDEIPYSRGGIKCYSKGFDINTESKVGTPRRLNLYDKVSEFHWDNKHKCSVQDGYSYTLSFTLPMFYGGRSIEQYPGIAQLKVDVWKRVYHWLSPISKICPPNGVQALLYLEEFQGHIREHQDMDPIMKVDPQTNSQIIGSSVIIVSFFNSQKVHFTAKGNEHKKHTFLTEHCSVYVLDPHDDNIYKHKTTFPGGSRNDPNGLRLALTFRWLGNRMKFFGRDNPVGLQHCQVVSCPYETINKLYPKSENARTLWRNVLLHKKNKGRLNNSPIPLINNQTKTHHTEAGHQNNIITI